MSGLTVHQVVFEPVQGFHLGAFGGLRVVASAGVVEEGVAGARIGDEPVLFVLGDQRGFQGGNSRVDA